MIRNATEQKWLTVMREGKPPTYYRGGHPLSPKAWTRSISRAKRMTGIEVANLIAWSQDVHNCKFEIAP